MDVTFHMEGMLLSPSPPASSTPSVLLSPGGFTGQCPAPSTPWGDVQHLAFAFGFDSAGAGGMKFCMDFWIILPVFS